MTYLAAFGIGACWSGYTQGKLITAENDEDAEEQAFRLASDFAHEKSPRWGSYSYDFEIINNSLQDTSLFHALKTGAKHDLVGEINHNMQQRLF